MKFSVLGVKIDNLTMGEALRRVEEFLSDGRQHYIVTPNPEFIVLAQKDREFERILNEADLAVADGIGVVWASRILNRQSKLCRYRNSRNKPEQVLPIPERVAGVDLMEKIIQIQNSKCKNQNDNVRFKKNKIRIFLLGGKNGAAEKATEVLKERYSNLEIGCSEDTESYRPIADILFVALGAPKQEKWIVENLSKLLSVKVAMGVGGAFDFISGRIKRAPVFIQRFGLEWFWRLAREPRRLKRVFNAAVKFPYLVLKNCFIHSQHLNKRKKLC